MMLEFVKLFTTPSVGLFVLVAIGLAAQIFPRFRVPGRWLGSVAAGILMLVALTPVSGIFAAPLLEAFPPFDAKASGDIDYIVHLSGAERPTLSRYRGEARLNSEHHRYFETARLARLYPKARIIFTGGYFTGSNSDIEMAGQIFSAFGLEGRIILLAGAKDTRDNARIVGQYLSLSERRPRLALVTSAMHMPRSILCFSAQGIQAIPAPSGNEPDLMRKLSGGSGVSPPRQLRQFDLAFHEWFGLLLYRLRGDTKSLWPAASS